MITRLFGTDGMRGEAGRFPVDAETMRLTGHSLAHRLSEQIGRAPRIVLGRDTRQSGGWIEHELIKGAREAGATCDSAGVITTPGVAFLARTLPADAGVVISASHNPYQDNGVKIFASSGRKLDDTTERLIEADIHAARGTDRSTPGSLLRESVAPEVFDEQRASRTVGSTEAEDVASSEASGAELRARYLDYLATEVAAGLRLDGLPIVVDCANGAASELGPALLARLGARVQAINNTPDGRNINRECGSLHIEQLCRTVVTEGAAFGVAYDGDADRALFVDAAGRLVDGDATLWVMAGYMAERGRLAGDCVVATVMTNLGLELALRARGIKLLRTNVGDKYVLEELLRTGASVGGEQSGHVIFPHISLAGDGLITTIKMLRAVNESGRTLQDLTDGFVRYPQVLLNVRVREKRPFMEVPEIMEGVLKTEQVLGENGRLLLRYSGTESLARVMIEGQRQDEIDRLGTSLAETIKHALGTHEG